MVINYQPEIVKDSPKLVTTYNSYVLLADQEVVISMMLQMTQTHTNDSISDRQ
jgi:hypothetical protein